MAGIGVFYTQLLILIIAASAQSPSIEQATLERYVRALKREVWLIVTWNIAASVDTLRWHNKNLGLTPFFAGASFVVPWATHLHGKRVSSAKEATELSGVHVVYAKTCISGNEGNPCGSHKTFVWCKHAAIATALYDLSSINKAKFTKIGYLVLSDKENARLRSTDLKTWTCRLF